MATKTDKFFTQIGDEIIELKGQQLQDFLDGRAQIVKELEIKAKAEADTKALKLSAYTKLGLTEEEINAIL